MNTSILEFIDCLNLQKRTIDNYKSFKRLDCWILLKFEDFTNYDFIGTRHDRAYKYGYGDHRNDQYLVGDWD